jgi:NOL1/NOP2/fmu family ribosome biogenesis protein
MFLEHALKQMVDFTQRLMALDLCAAPGGKSTLLASLLNEQSLLLSNEVIPSRVSMLTENLTKWGQLNTWVCSNDPKQFAPINNLFDIVLIDAPCSGSGLFRKMPDFVNDWDMDHVHLCSQRQQRIVHDIFPSVKEGGIMVYMTCSFCEEENEQMVDMILQEFDVDSCAIDIPAEWGIVETTSRAQQGYGYRFFPHLLNGEGFFLACFKKRTSGEKPNKIDPNRSRKNKTDLTSLQSFVDTENKVGLLQNDHLMLIEAAHAEYAEYFAQHLKVVKKGILCGKVIRGELIPEHELAMYAHLRRDIPAVDVNLEQAVRYLQREPIEIDCPAKGWFLLRYEGQHLGWIKNLGNRINNYYPSHYRILNKHILD